MEENLDNPSEIQVSIAQNTGTQSPTHSTSNRIYEGITNFFGRFDPRAQLFDNVEDMNTLARTNTVTSRPPNVTEHTVGVMSPPSAHDLHSPNLHAEGGPVFRFDLEAGPKSKDLPFIHRPFEGRFNPKIAAKALIFYLTLFVAHGLE